MTRFNHQDGHCLEIAGANIYYECQGNADGPSLVFLHGGFGDIETFNALTPHLGKTHHLIGIDSRGQGKSTLGSTALTYKRLQQDAQAVARHLGLERFALVGHSDGGIAALRLAASGTCAVQRLVVLGAHWALAADDPARDLYRTITAARWRTMFPSSYTRYQALNPEADFERLTDALLGLWLDTSEDGYPDERVRRIGSPLLVVRGDEDKLVSRLHALELAERVDGAKLANLPFCGHSPHEDDPHGLLHLLQAFLAAPAAD